MGATVFHLLMLLKYINSEIEKYRLCLGNILRGFSVNNMKKAGLNWPVYEFSVDYKTFDTNDIIDIHKYSMKRHNIK